LCDLLPTFNIENNQKVNTVLQLKWRYDLEFKNCDEAPAKRAFLGVRSCDLAAIQIQDRVFLPKNSKDSKQNSVSDPSYSHHRNENFFIAVNCTVSSSTCFCASMQTGPMVKTRFDISITEIAKAPNSIESLAQNAYVFRSGSEQGEKLLQSLSMEEPPASLLEAEASAIEQNTMRMKPTPAPEEAAALLKQNASSSKWQEIESRCLSCANCTMVCPTCFCSTVDDVVNLSGTESKRERKWDSCFNPDFSYIHGGEIRTKTARGHPGAWNRAGRHHHSNH
jgi:ferredoxin